MRRPLAVLVTALVLSPATHALEARWDARTARVHYAGFTADYSCEGLRDKLRHLLKAVGAGPDVEIRTRACINGPGDVEPFITADLAFSVPVEAAGGDVSAAWTPVTLGGAAGRLDAGDCELLEHFRDQVLPTLPHRIESQNLGCVPGQRLVAPSLRVSVLVAQPG